MLYSETEGRMGWGGAVEARGEDGGEENAKWHIDSFPAQAQSTLNHI